MNTINDDFKAKVMAKGQITIPKEIRNDLKLKEGDSISFIKNANGGYEIVNSSLYTIRMIQNAINEIKDKVELTDEEVAKMVEEFRADESNYRH